ncbi:MAG: response regulator [Bdellovibrionales bacterium]|nr:response regulator [Bdellovibrionales bacterium]
MERILLIDDEPNVLKSFKRHFRGDFELLIESDPLQALDTLKSNPDISVVVSDMQMPRMDGISLLQEVQKLRPNIVRMMLTGIADQEIAVKAVNESNIFRFLNKPCSIEDLSKALNDAIKQARLVNAEKELLQNTLSGSVKVLTDILSMVDPKGFGKTMQLRESIRDLCKIIKLDSYWDIELAAMLSNIGLIVIPHEISQKHLNGEKLSAEEETVLARIPSVSAELIRNIPRLESVAKIINPELAETRTKKEKLGSSMIFALQTLSTLEARGVPNEKIVDLLRSKPEIFSKEIVDGIEKLINKGSNIDKLESQNREKFNIRVAELVPGQILLADVFTKEGVLLVSKGVKVTDTLVERINNYATFVGVNEPLVVNCRIPTEDI